MTSRGARQTADRAMLVRPAAFGFNPETAGSNAFQARAGAAVDAPEAARRESAALVGALRAEGVEVHVVDDTVAPPKPDAVFPNNWVSFHADGTVVLYPMLAASRRAERRHDAVEAAARALGFPIARVLDLSPHEREGRFLEGTGSLVLDHVGRIAYAARSSRTDERLVQDWCALLGYEACVFDALDAAGRPYYHTNVVLSIGSRFAVLCAEAIPDGQREAVRGRLLAGGRELIEIPRAAAGAFAANILELATWDESLGDAAVLALSASARRALDGPAWQRLAGCVDATVVVDVPTIERLGGGSVRCMIAEVFVPTRLP